MISRSSSIIGTTRRTMSTTATITPSPAFPPPIPITYTWSTPNALRRLSLPPLTTERAPSPTQAPPAIPYAGAGSSRSMPVGARRRPLPRPPTSQYRPNEVHMQMEESGHFAFPDPYAYSMPQVHHHQPAPAPTATHHFAPEQAPIGSSWEPRQMGRNARPSSSYTVPNIAVAPDLVPLVRQTGRLSFSDPLSHSHYQSQPQVEGERPRGRGPQVNKPEKEKERRSGLERRLSVSSIVAMFTGRKAKSRSRSRSGSGSRNLLDDE